MGRKGSFLIFGMSLLMAACSSLSTEAPARITGVRAHPDGGVEFDLVVENPLDHPSSVHCSVDSVRANHSVAIESEIPASEVRRVTTRMEHLPVSTRPDELDAWCVAD